MKKKMHGIGAREVIYRVNPGMKRSKVRIQAAENRDLHDLSSIG